jgi:non-heme chloroperoxidase
MSQTFTTLPHTTGSIMEEKDNSNRIRTRPAITLRDGTTLFLRDWGHGKPLLFLAGWALPSDMWFYQMAPLSAQGFRCIAYDRRGHGRSSDPGYGYDFDTLSDDLSEVIDQLGLNDIAVVTHSMAAGEVTRYLTRHGAQKVRRVAFIAPAGLPYALKTADNPNGIDALVFEKFHKEHILGDFAQWCDDNEKPYFAPGYHKAMMDYTKSMMLRSSLQALHDFHVSGSTTDFRVELAQLAVPVLILHGDLDVSAPLGLYGVPTSKLIPGARLKVYSQAAHGLYFTHKEKVNEDLKEFCEDR